MFVGLSVCLSVRTMVITVLTYLGLCSDDCAARLTEAIYRSSHFRSYLLSPTCCLNGFINAVIIAVAERLMFCMLQSRSLAGSTFPAQSDDIACRLVSSPHPLTGGLRCLGGGWQEGWRSLDASLLHFLQQLPVF